MKFCLYQLGHSSEVRVGAQAPWSDASIVDVHRAEVALLAAKATSRRAHEIAEHLVPSHPAAFLTAGAHVWDFAREAVLAATPDAVTPRGEDVVVDARSAVLVPVLDQLLASGDEVPAASPSGLRAVAGHPVLVIVGGHAHRTTPADAWSRVAAYVDLAADATALLTRDELGDDDNDVRDAVVSVVCAASAEAALLPGDAVCDPAVLAAVREADFEDLLVSA